MEGSQKKTYLVGYVAFGLMEQCNDTSSKYVFWCFLELKLNRGSSGAVLYLTDFGAWKLESEKIAKRIWRFKWTVSILFYGASSGIAGDGMIDYCWKCSRRFLPVSELGGRWSQKIRHWSEIWCVPTPSLRVLLRELFHGVRTTMEMLKEVDQDTVSFQFFIRNEFSLNFKSTIGVITLLVEFNLVARSSRAKSGTPLDAGQERYRAMTSPYYLGALGTFIVYDITRKVTFENVERWLRELRDRTDQTIVVMLAGNKADLAHLRAVPTDKAKAFAEREHMFFYGNIGSQSDKR
ncbi:putative small GTPase, P-loop containing nucleoside triphosphate hydrolase [Helianthus annuus]|nr:putative small GTPase, P-loop containing nucleoside triphosphate hydrolase [Helianthus annuus]